MSTALDDERLPAWVTWRHRPFPDANLLLVRRREPALVDSGFTGHARETADWVCAHAGQVTLAVNTHWHSDHVGGNALLQASGPGIAASAADAAAVARRDPGCCQSLAPGRNRTGSIRSCRFARTPPPKREAHGE